jgi:response regulator NasT
MKKLLLIEDDHLVSATLVEGLGRHGYEVGAAYTGSDGIDLAGRLMPDLVLLDLRLPDLSGIEVAKIFRLTATPFIVLSAYDDIDAVRCTSEFGALCYLVKPVSVKQLIPILETTIARGSEVLQLRKSDEQLRGVVDTGLVVATATGILMERHDQSRETAYEQLRRSARTRRAKVRDCATEVVLEVEHRDRGTGPDVAK